MLTFPKLRDERILSKILDSSGIGVDFFLYYCYNIMYRCALGYNL